MAPTVNRWCGLKSRASLRTCSRLRFSFVSWAAAKRPFARSPSAMPLIRWVVSSRSSRDSLRSVSACVSAVSADSGARISWATCLAIDENCSAISRFRDSSRLCHSSRRRRMKSDMARTSENKVPTRKTGERAAWMPVFSGARQTRMEPAGVP